jgi:hypothetical protein
MEGIFPTYSSCGKRKGGPKAALLRIKSKSQIEKLMILNSSDTTYMFVGGTFDVISADVTTIKIGPKSCIISRC